MLPARSPHPGLFLLIYSSIGTGLVALTLWSDGPGIGAFFLTGGVVLSALWYRRWVQYLTIGIFLALLVPLVLRLDMSPAMQAVFFGVAAVALVALAETITQLVNGLRSGAQLALEAHEQLRENERQLLEIVQNSPAVLFRALPDGTRNQGWRFVFNSVNVLTVTGYTPEELHQDPELWLSRVHPDDRARVATAARGTAEGPNRGAPVVYDYRFQHKSGRIIWLQNTMHVARDAAGQPQELTGQSLDITERRQAELAVAEQRQIQDESVRNSPTILFRGLPDPGSPDGWAFVYHSANTLDVLGYSVDEIATNADLWLSRIHPDDRERVLTTSRLLATVGPEHPMPMAYDYRFQHKDGRELWIQDVQRVVFDDGGRPTVLYGQSIDITARKQAELALSSGLRKLDEIVSNSPAALFHALPDPTAPDGLRYIYHSSNVETLTGRDRVGFRGRCQRVVESYPPGRSHSLDRRHPGLPLRAASRRSTAGAHVSIPARRWARDLAPGHAPRDPR